MDLRYRDLLDHELTQAAKNYIKHRGRGQGAAPTTKKEPADTDTQPPPAKKRVTLLASLSQKAKGRALKVDAEADAVDPVEKEVETYSTMAAILEGECPLLWWKVQKANFPVLHDMALNLLVMRASSTPSERLFSVASNVQTLGRNKLNAETLRHLVLGKINHKNCTLKL